MKTKKSLEKTFSQLKPHFHLILKFKFSYSSKATFQACHTESFNFTNVALRKAEEKLFVFLSDKLGLCFLSIGAQHVARFSVLVRRTRECIAFDTERRRHKIISRRDSDKFVEIFREREKIYLIKPPFCTKYCCTGLEKKKKLNIPKELIVAFLSHHT